MSGLEKFNPRPSGLYRLKDFLLRERPIARESLNSTNGSEDSITLDFDQSFAQIIKAHMNKNTKKHMENKENMGNIENVGNKENMENKENVENKENMENKENVENKANIENKENMEVKENIYKSVCENTLHTSINQKLEQKDSSREATVYCFNDSTIIKDTLSDSDDSFEELERMCNKTLSDPNNTIHQFLAKYKKAKRNSGLNDVHNESACLQRLLKEIDEQLEGNGEEHTQLNDIEEPSCLWENTMDITGLLMTPDRKIKYKPKTPAIVEEETHSETGSEGASLRSNDNDSVPADRFLTANETLYISAQTEKTFSSLKSYQGEESELGVQEKSEQNSLSTTLIDLDCSEEPEQTTETASNSVQTNETDLGLNLPELSTKDSNDSVELICLEEDEENNASVQGSESEASKENIELKFEELSVTDSNNSLELICLDESEDNKTITQSFQSNFALSDTFYVTPRQNESQRMSQTNLIDLEAPTPKIKLEPVRPKIITDINGDSIILLSDEDESYDEHNYSESHNTAFSLDLEESTNLDLSGIQNLDKKCQFNDTLEEVDYIMKQGMKYLADTKQLPKCLKTYTEEMCSPSPISSPQTPNTVIKKKAKKQLIPQEKPKPTIDHFKKPQVITRIPQCKFLAATKKPTHFQHIVSPVGAYIKNTPKIPITTEFKSTANVFQSKAARGLDYSLKENCSKKAEQSSKECFSSLPKKAYISSDVKHVIDQRKPAIIPGGEKIHRFLHSSKAPAVIRHEGKIKSNIPFHPPSRVPNKADNSLADLSTISGDISVHILKDAKR